MRDLIAGIFMAVVHDVQIEPEPLATKESHVVSKSGKLPEPSSAPVPVETDEDDEEEEEDDEDATEYVSVSVGRRPDVPLFQVLNWT